MGRLIRYEPSNQLPRSISLQRSEQKGRKGFAGEASSGCDFLQMGQRGEWAMNRQNQSRLWPALQGIWIVVSKPFNKALSSANRVRLAHVRIALVLATLGLISACAPKAAGPGRLGLTSTSFGQQGRSKTGVGPILKFTLENGLQVVLEENRSAPVVAVQTWVKVGAADEPDRLAGVSHFLEHMLFKGTKRRGVGQIAREIEQAGGEINAWTSFDETVYHVVLASEFLDVGLDVLSDAVTNSSLDPVEFDRERGVILEEVKQGLDDPDRGAAQKMFAGAFRGHTYARPVIGSIETVSAMTRDEVYGFYRDHYVSSNMTLVVVGDFDTETVKTKIQTVFGSLRKAGKAAPLGRPSMPPPSARQVDVLTRDVKESQVLAAFRIPAIRDEDIPALDLLSVVLGQGESSRLNLEVVRNRQLAKSAFSYVFGARDGGVLVAGAVTGGNRVETVTQAVLDEVGKLSRLPLGRAELEKARTILESDRVYDRETVQGYARKLGYYATIVGDIHYEAWYLSRVRSLGAEDLRKVANKYLRAEHVTVVAQIPEKNGKGKPVGNVAAAKAALEKMASELEARSDRRLRGKLPPANTRENVVLHTLPGGAKLIVMQDSSVPIVAMRAMWLGGLRYEDEKSNGVSNLIGQLLTRGTHTRSAEQIMTEVESLAGSLSGYAGRNSVGVQAEFLSRNWEQGAELFADCLLHASFPDDELEKERKIVLDDIRAQDDNLGHSAFRLFHSQMWHSHPYRLDVIGSTDSVSGLTRRRLLIHFRKHYLPSALTIAIVGDADPTELAERFSRLFSDATEAEPIAPNIAPEPVTNGPRQSIQFRDREQAHVVLGYPGTSLANPDRFGLEVLSYVLAGQGGRLFEELRERRGLVYRVSAFSLEGIDPGYFAVYLACSPDKLELAMQTVRTELAKVITEGITAEELDRAQRYLIGTHAIGLQRKGSLAAALAFHEAYGEGWNAYKKFPDRVHKVTLAEVKRIARKYLVTDREVMAVVKPNESTPAAETKAAASNNRAARRK